MRYISLALILALSACAPKAEEPRRAIVKTVNGPIIGVVGPDFFRFDNLPYSRNQTTWATPRDASTAGPACQANAGDGDPCLNLTLIAPVGHAQAPVDIAFDPVASRRPGAILVIAHIRPNAPQDPEAVQNWVRANIGAFGGNPDQMRVIGPKTR